MGGIYILGPQGHWALLVGQLSPYHSARLFTTYSAACMFWISKVVLWAKVLLWLLSQVSAIGLEPLVGGGGGETARVFYIILLASSLAELQIIGLYS